MVCRVNALTWGLYKHFNSNTSLVGEKVHFHKIDFKNKGSLESIPLENQSLISICWALNESEFNAEFWTEVVLRAKKAILVFVEGKEDQLVKIQEIAGQAGRPTVFELQLCSQTHFMCVEAEKGHKTQSGC